MFGYLKAKPNKTLAFDPSHPDIDEARFQKCDWQEFYRLAKELVPGDAPEPRGNVVSSNFLWTQITRVTESPVICKLEY
jgi:hypothetical protein